MLEIWIARDEDCLLYAFPSKPVLGESNTVFVPANIGVEKAVQLPINWFPEVRFNNSPVKLTLSNELAMNAQTAVSIQTEVEPIKRRR